MKKKITYSIIFSLLLTMIGGLFISTSDFVSALDGVSSHLFSQSYAQTGDGENGGQTLQMYPLMTTTGGTEILDATSFFGQIAMIANYYPRGESGSGYPMLVIGDITKQSKHQLSTSPMGANAAIIPDVTGSNSYWVILANGSMKRVNPWNNYTDDTIVDYPAAQTPSLQGTFKGGVGHTEDGRFSVIYTYGSGATTVWAYLPKEKQWAVTATLQSGSNAKFVSDFGSNFMMIQSGDRVSVYQSYDLRSWNRIGGFTCKSGFDFSGDILGETLYVAFSPDGSKLAYTEFNGQSNAVYLLQDVSGIGAISQAEIAMKPEGDGGVVFWNFQRMLSTGDDRFPTFYMQYPTATIFQLTGGSVKIQPRARGNGSGGISINNLFMGANIKPLLDFDLTRTAELNTERYMFIHALQSYGATPSYIYVSPILIEKYYLGQASSDLSEEGQSGASFFSTSQISGVRN